MRYAGGWWGLVDLLRTIGEEDVGIGSISVEVEGGRSMEQGVSEVGEERTLCEVGTTSTKSGWWGIDGVICNVEVGGVHKKM